MRYAAIIASIPLAGSLFGCSAIVAEPAEGADSEPEPVLAIFELQQATDPADGSLVKARGSARFLRAAGGPIDDIALKTAGADVELPPPSTCMRLAERSVWLADEVRAVALEDVGPVTIDYAGTRTELGARRLPEVVDLVQGVVYAGGWMSGLRESRTLGSTSYDHAALPHRAVSYRVAGSREASVSAFDVTVGAPRGLDDIRVNGDLASSVIALDSDAPIELAWSARPARDIIYVDVTASDSSIMRCAFEGDGAGAIPTDDLARNGMLTIHHFHREQIDTDSPEQGEVRVDVSRALRFERD